MSPDDHQRWSDSVAPYLLAALPDDELRAYQAHLRQCAICREEVEELSPAVHALAASVEPMEAPPTLRDRIMAEVEREAALLSAAGPDADRAPAPRRLRRLPSLAWLRPPALAAAAALLLVGVLAGLAGAGALSGDGHTVTASVDNARAPRARVDVEIAGRTATLVARGLPAPPRDRIYEIWLKRPGQPPEPTSALFMPRHDGTATATVTGPLGGVEQVMVTDEPAGGSAVPTRDPLIVADMS